MWDVVDLDDEAIEEYASNELLGQFLSNTVFRSGILAIILFNSLLIAVETDQALVSILGTLGRHCFVETRVFRNSAQFF